MTSYFDGNLEMLVTDSLDLKNRQMILPPKSYWNHHEVTIISLAHFKFQICVFTLVMKSFLDCERGIIFKELVSTETNVIVAASQQVIPEAEEVENGGRINSMHQQHYNWLSLIDSFSKKINDK